MLGSTSFGSQSIVQLTNTAGHYEGVFGGKGLTDLKCDASPAACQGTFAGYGTRLDLSKAPAQLLWPALSESLEDSTEFEVSGAVNLRRLVVSRTAEAFKATQGGTLSLKKVTDGLYRGFGYTIIGEPNSRFEAELEMSGSFVTLKDPVFWTMVLALPIIRR